MACGTVLNGADRAGGTLWRAVPSGAAPAHLEEPHDKGSTGAQPHWRFVLVWRITASDGDFSVWRACNRCTLVRRGTAPA